MGDLWMLEQERLRVAVLESPYDSLNSPEARELFGKLCALKLKGYGYEYPYGVMPVDATDFICTHLAVGRESRSGFEPIMAYKSIRERKCRLHGVQFSGLQVPQSSGAAENVLAVQEIIQAADQSGSVVAYDGGWTIDPEVRKNRQLVTELRNLFTCIQVFHHSQFTTFDLLCCGLLRFKTENVFFSWGYSPLSWQGKSLPSFAQASLQGEKVLMMHTRKFSDAAFETSERYRGYWENRISLGETGTDLEIGVKKAA